jgi:hypothetical protein
MRVKLVSSISNEGATASSVNAMIIVMLSLGWLTVPPRFTEIVPPEPALDVPLGVTGDCGAFGEVAVTTPPDAVPPPDPLLYPPRSGALVGAWSVPTWAAVGVEIGEAMARAGVARLARASAPATTSMAPIARGNNLLNFCMALQNGSGRERGN